MSLTGGLSSAWCVVPTVMAVMTRFVSMRHQIDKPQPFRQDHISNILQQVDEDRVCTL
jgi:hypothetical protein